MNACARTVSWKEEVLLHDGSKVIVTRIQTRQGNHELGQNPPIKEQKIIFKLSNGEQIVWEDDFSPDIRSANFDLFALHILNNVPYLIASPSGCLSYNKWKRPNPPYVVFSYTAHAWKAIPLSSLPKEFNAMNLIINTSTHIDKLNNLISAKQVEKFNSTLKQLEYKTIIRAPLPEVDLCPDYSLPRYTSPKAPSSENTAK